MKNKFKVIVSVMLICLALFTMSGCSVTFGWYKHYGAYFATWEELDAYISENAYGKSVSYYLSPGYYVDMPDDDRFVESAYIIYNTNGMNANLKKLILNVFSHTAFRLEIEGEEVYIFGFKPTMDKKTFHNETLVKFDSIDQMIEMSGDVPLLLSNVAMFDRDFRPKGFMKKFFKQSTSDSREIYEKSICYGYGKPDKDGVMIVYETWAIYDTRDVSQAEKEALASELLEILYNNYKLAGEKAE